MRRLFHVVTAGLIAPFLHQHRLKNNNEEEEEDANLSEIETTINKIFLTSLQSEFSTLKLFALDA